MQNNKPINLQRLSRYVGWSLIGSIIVGVVAAMTISSGIDINLSADIAKTSENMLDAESRLRGKAYLALFSFMLQIFISIGLFLLLRKSGLVLATWSFLIAVSAAVVGLLGAVYAMNAALIADNSAFDIIAGGAQRLLLTSLQVTSDYTSFHLSLVLSSAANAGIFLLFFKSGLIPKLISAWGVFASLFVVVALVGRDFIPLLGHGSITVAFMLSNLIAMIALGLYLGIRGVKIQNPLE
ncbi:MAG: hypothetical protein ACI9SP_004227 [Arenicella sp.]|jgi:hypothetical protein